jgi:hypothetical protein
MTISTFNAGVYTGHEAGKLTAEHCIASEAHRRI